MSLTSISQLVTSKKELVPTSYKLTSLEIKEKALMIAGPLASIEEPNNMTAWYCKAFRVLGEGRYTACAKAANEGKTPKRLFGFLLKTEMKRVQRGN